MDITTIFGLLLGISAVLVSFLMEGGHISSLLQAALIFPALFMLSRKLRNLKDFSSIAKWASIAEIGRASCRERV